MIDLLIGTFPIIIGFLGITYLNIDENHYNKFAVISLKTLYGFSIGVLMLILSFYTFYSNDLLDIIVIAIFDFCFIYLFIKYTRAKHKDIEKTLDF